MIINTPSFESLNISALRFHYSAWEAIIDIHSAFEWHYRNEGGPNTMKEDWEDYKERSVHDFHSILTGIAQANELSLRSKICRVSPFLLLINTENKFRQSKEDVDFTSLRTLDAIDLPSVVNAVCEIKLSDEFIQSYNLVRSMRNQIMHLGTASKAQDWKKLLALLVEQYSELWSGESWFPNWLSHSERKRSAHFFDQKNYSSSTDVMYAVPFLTENLTKSQFQVIFGFQKMRRRYICHSCCYEACLERHGLDLSDYKTAYLFSSTQLWCGVCEEKLAVERRKCIESDCEGDVISMDEGFEEICCSCGYSQV